MFSILDLSQTGNPSLAINAVMNSFVLFCLSSSLAILCKIGEALAGSLKKFSEVLSFTILLLLSIKVSDFLQDCCTSKIMNKKIIETRYRLSLAAESFFNDIFI